MSHELPKSCLASGVNTGAETFAHLDSNGIAHERPESPQLSPLDRAFAGLLTVTQVAVEHAEDWKGQHGLMLSASAVSVAEDYFRTILTESVIVCPCCVRIVSSLETRMEFVLSGSLSEALRSLLAGKSFSSKETVRAWSKTLTGLEIPVGTSLGRALLEFELVCHVRHCAVHAGGYIGERNASVLGVPSGRWIAFSASSVVHTIVAVVTATIRAFNQALFEHLLGRWIDESVLTGVWKEDRAILSRSGPPFDQRST